MVDIIRKKLRWNRKIILRINRHYFRTILRIFAINRIKSGWIIFVGRTEMIFKELETKRLLLKNIAMDDADFILSQFSDNDVNEYLFDEEPMTDITEAIDLINFYICPEPRGQHRWILVRKSDGVRIGTCGFHCWDRKSNYIEIGYDMKKAFWGNGYMQEAVEAIIKLAKEKLMVHRIDAHIYYQNERSIALVSKLGFHFNGETEKLVFREKEYLHHIYTLLL